MSISGFRNLLNFWTFYDSLQSAQTILNLACLLLDYIVHLTNSLLPWQRQRNMSLQCLPSGRPQILTTGISLLALILHFFLFQIPEIDYYNIF